MLGLEKDNLAVKINKLLWNIRLINFNIFGIKNLNKHLFLKIIIITHSGWMVETCFGTWDHGFDFLIASKIIFKSGDWILVQAIHLIS